MARAALCAGRGYNRDMSPEGGDYASRGGLKLAAALEAFDLGVAGLICADFGCNVGGFTDCLLRAGAAKVYAVDTGYGQLAWKLRKDPRVVVMERTNALYCRPPEEVDLVAVDVGWTVQELIVPAAMSWLKEGGKVVSLLKPHYELARLEGRKPFARLGAGRAEQACRTVCGRLAEAGWPARAAARSALAGKGGNVEFFLLLAARGGRG